MFTSPAEPQAFNLMRAGPIKSRPLPYAEMMNGGRQQMDEDDHAREQELEHALAGEGTNSIPLDRAVS